MTTPVPGAPGGERIRRVMPPSVNYHLWAACNMRCRFCFATFDDVIADRLPRRHLAREDACRMVDILARRFRKVTFAGGEPTLCPWLDQLVDVARRAGATTAPREIYQRFGQACAALDPGVWIRPFRLRVGALLAAGSRVVCTDLRTSAELRAARDMGGIVWPARGPPPARRARSAVAGLIPSSSMSLIARTARPEGVTVTDPAWASPSLITRTASGRRPKDPLRGASPDGARLARRHDARRGDERSSTRPVHRGRVPRS